MKKDERNRMNRQIVNEVYEFTPLTKFGLIYRIGV